MFKLDFRRHSTQSNIIYLSIFNVAIWVILIKFNLFNIITCDCKTELDKTFNRIAGLSEDIITKNLDGSVKHKHLAADSDIELKCPMHYESVKQLRVYDQGLLDENSNKLGVSHERFIMAASPPEQNSIEAQMKAFRETLVLGIYLNRTVVLPTFLKSKMALSHEENIHSRLSKPANEQINLNKLLRYVSIISPEELYKHCASFDIAYTFQDTKFPLKMSILRELDFLEKQSGVHILEPESDILRAKVVKADLSFNGTAPELNSENIEHYFDYHDHNAKCALVINPENDVKYLTHLKRWSEMVGSEKDFVTVNHDPEMVTSMVMKMTSRPKYIRDMTENFKRAYNLDRGYISVVYDPNYFDTLIKIIVKTAETYSFKTVYLIVEQKYSEDEEIRIYKQLEQRLTRIGVRLLDRKTTREFVQIEYRDCPSERLNDDLEETLNLILQQIALVSSSFIGCAIAETPSHDLVRNMIEERLAYRYHEFDYYMI